MLQSSPLKSFLAAQTGTGGSDEQSAVLQQMLRPRGKFSSLSTAYCRILQKLMRPIRLPEPPGGFRGVSEVFEGAIRRAIVIGNGFAGAESQCIGLVRALGLANRHSLYVRVYFTSISTSSFLLRDLHFSSLISSSLLQKSADHYPLQVIERTVFWGPYSFLRFSNTIRLGD